MARRPSYPGAGAVPVDPGSEGILPRNGNYQVLDPDYGPQTIHRSDLLFINSTPRMNTRQNGELSPQSSTTSPSISSQLYPYHQQAFYRYPSSPQPIPPPPPASTYVRNVHVQYPDYVQRQRAFTSPQATHAPPPPPVPPKPTPITSPSLGPSSPPLLRDASYAARPQSYQPPPSLPPHEPPALPPPPPPIPESQEPEEQVASPIEDGDELAMVLALSQSESVQRQKLEEKLLDQEEQDLARALAESMLSTGARPPASSNPFFSHPDAVATSSRVTLDEPRDQHPPAPTPSAPLPPPALQEGLPAPIAAENPWASASSADSAEFGRYDKWRIPGLPEKQKEEPPFVDSEPETSKGKRPNISETASSPQQVPRTDSPRPLSVFSASMLPYTLPSPSLQDGYDGVSGTEDVILPSSTEDSTTPQSSALYNVDVLEQTENSDTVLVFDDEAYARQLAAEEEELLRQELESRRGEKGQAESSQPLETEVQDLPLYTMQEQQSEWQASELYSESHSNNRSHSTSQPQHESRVPFQSMGGSHPNYPSSIPENQPASFTRRESDAGVVSSTPAATPYTPPYPVVHPSIGNRRESEPDTRSEASHHSSTYSAVSAPAVYHDRPTTQNMTSLPADNGGPSNSPQAAHLSTAGMVNPNHFLDRELLTGVSIGFKPPAISSKLVPMQDPMPNIISLPYARCPPLHFQGPDWRHMLRLMARLSGTRIEPTVEAMAISKTELKLRIVVQFVKPHSSSNTWRTVLWFSIDHPIPPAAPGANRYLSGNPNLLPWSYTLSPVPMLLRDAADTQISKAFTIPVTDAVPLPNLPITFPNLALYLQAALDASRRHSDANGHGKLGKMVQTCYPASVEETHSDFDIPDRRGGVERLFKRVIGRSNKEKKKGKSSNNEETYQLVTPFVPDEWGG